MKIRKMEKGRRKIRKNEKRKEENEKCKGKMTERRSW